MKSVVLLLCWLDSCSPLPWQLVCWVCGGASPEQHARSTPASPEHRPGLRQGRKVLEGRRCDQTYLAKAPRRGTCQPSLWLYSPCTFRQLIVSSQRERKLHTNADKTAGQVEQECLIWLIRARLQVNIVFFFVVVVSLVFFLTLMPLSRCARVTAADTDLFPRTQFKLPGSRIPGTHTRISAFHIYRPRFFPLLCQLFMKIVTVINPACACVRMSAEEDDFHRLSKGGWRDVST